MAKLTKGGDSSNQLLELDPAVEHIRDALEENLVFFLRNVSAMLQKYKDYVAAVDPPAYVRLVQQQQEIPGLPPSQQSLRRSGSTGNVAALATGGPAGTDNEAAAASASVAEGAAGAGAALTEAALKSLVNPAVPDRSKTIRLEIEEPDADEEEDANPALESPETTSDEDESDEDIDNIVTEAEAQADADAAALEAEFPDNTALTAQLRLLKRESYALETTFNGIHDWTALNVVTTDDEEGPVSQALEAVMEQTASLTESLRSTYDLYSTYLAARFGLEHDAAKYPDCYSYRDSLLMLEVNTWDELRQAWRVLLRTTMILHTFLAKNMKLLTKRSLKSERQRLFV
jgi:hypothetical protein